MIAKTDAAGGPGLLPEVLAFSSSLEQDRALLREDLVERGRLTLRDPS